MKRFIVAMTLAAAIGVASQADAMANLTDNLKKVVDFSTKVADTSIALNKFGQDLTSVKLKLENLLKMVRNGAIGTTDLPNLLGQYFIDLGNVVNGSLRSVNTTTLDALAVLSDNVLSAQQKNNSTLANLGSSLNSIGNQIRSVKFHTNMNLNALRISSSNINTAIFNQAVSNPNKVTAATKVKAVMNIVPSTVQTVLGLIEAALTSAGQLQALSQMIGEMAPAQKLRVVGGNMIELVNPFEKLAIMLKDIADVTALFNDKVGQAGNAIVGVVVEIKGLLLQFGEVLASARDAGQAGPVAQPLVAQPSYQAPSTPVARPSQTQTPAAPYQAPQYQTQQQWQQGQPTQGASVPSPYQMVRPAGYQQPSAQTPSYNPAGGYQQFAVPQK